MVHSEVSVKWLVLCVQREMSSSTAIITHSILPNSALPARGGSIKKYHRQILMRLRKMLQSSCSVRPQDQYW
eukprot:COSAG02_NODE_7422_length_3023_cov_2.812244_2_plen_72_part_00